MSDQRMLYLLDGYLQKTLLAEELDELFRMVISGAYDSLIQQKLDRDLMMMNISRELPDEIGQAMLDKILTADLQPTDNIYEGRSFSPSTPAHRVHFLKTSWFRYAAALLLIAATATFLYLKNTPPKEMVKNQAGRIVPGSNKATLTLSDGSTIILDSAAIGQLTQQGSTRITKVNSGSLAYQPGNEMAREVLYNMISTPKGGQYQVTLPDGSRVWLNAASSIQFPTAFVKDRKVKITGEAYFEVIKDSKKPFWVSANGTEVEVLGTDFNVNAYEDEAGVKISLLNGAVKIDQTILKPGQAFFHGKAVTTTLDQDLAWKNGVFDFDNVPLEKAARQLSKWYNVEIVYEKGIVPNITFGGKMGRNLNFDEILYFLKLMGVHYKLEQNSRLIITG